MSRRYLFLLRTCRLPRRLRLVGLRQLISLPVLVALSLYLHWANTDGWVSANGWGGYIGQALLQDQLARHHYRVDDGRQRTVVVILETP